MRVSTVSGVVIFSGTSGAYFGGADAEWPCLCESALAGSIVIAKARAA
jgi:hypothetical protein